MGSGGQRHAPAALPSGKTRYRLYRRLGGSQGRFRRYWYWYCTVLVLALHCTARYWYLYCTGTGTGITLHCTARYWHLYCTVLVLVLALHCTALVLVLVPVLVLYCSVLLPPGGNRNAVKKYIIYYHFNCNAIYSFRCQLNILTYQPITCKTSSQYFKAPV